MSADLSPPPFDVQPFDIKQNRFVRQWQDWFLKIIAQIAAAFAPVDGSYVVTGNVPGLTNQFDLGLLTSGLLKQTVALSIATPSIASPGTDYTALAFKTIHVATQTDVVADTAADTLTLVAGSGTTITTNAATDTITISATGSGGTVTTTGSPSSGDITKFSGASSITNATAGTDYTALAFKTIQVATQSDIVADSAADTLTLVAGSNITITTNAGTDTVTFAASGGSGTVTTTGSPASGNLTKFSGATSVTNADLTGDVTTTGTVATTIAANAVTFAKMQDIATQTLIGRDTAGTSDPESVTISQALDWLGV